MSAEVIRITKRIRREISELYEIKKLALRRWQKTLRDEDYLGSVAFDLQGFYQGVERVFEIVAKSIDRSVPDGENLLKIHRGYVYLLLANEMGIVHWKVSLG